MPEGVRLSSEQADQAEQIQALHDAHVHALWRFALTLTGGDRGRAEDVVQETLLRAWRSSAQLGTSDGATRAWLYTVARRLVIDDWRTARSRHEVLRPQAPDTASVQDETERVLQTWVLGDALRRLSPPHRQVLVECYYGGCTTAEAARRLGIPEGTVKSRTHYALRALRLVLEEMGVHE